MRHKPSPLPSCSFTIIIAAVSRCTRIEWSTPFTFWVQSTHEADWFVEIKFVRLGKAFILCFGFKITHCFCKDRDTPVIIRIFQSFGHWFVFAVTRDISDGILIIFCFRHEMRQYQIRTFDAGSVIFSGTQAGFISLFGIKIAIPFHVGIHDDRNSMITNHSAGVIGSQVPHGVYPTFLMLLN